MADPRPSTQRDKKPGAVWRSALLGLLLLATVLGTIWWPELSHWHVRPQTLSDSELLRIGGAPPQARLDEIAALQLRGVVVSSTETVATADAVMKGQLRLPTFPAGQIHLPFSPVDLESGSPAWQLMLASLAVPDVLLDAFRASGRTEYLDAARQAIVAFSNYEATRWVDKGLLWNDHAIAARITVLVKFWSEYRRGGGQDPVVARAVFTLLARGALLLAKDDAYAWRTSHGIVADLGLLQVAAAFPDLPEALAIRRTAVERFAQHLDYWINDEGVTLLHSAGYHAGSLYHLSMGLRLLTLNGITIPAPWWDRYERAVNHLALLQRPDGSLPMFGDTMSTAQPAAPLLTARGPDGILALPLAPRPLPQPSIGATLYPAAGYAIWLDAAGTGAPDGRPQAQTVLTWAYHRGLGHKVADELSLLFWAHGRPWLTNTGYWPYGARLRQIAEGWPASNAPHLEDEGQDSERSSTIQATGTTEHLAFIDLQRSGKAGPTIRRQVVRLPDEDAWLVLDQGTGKSALLTQWTIYPGLRVEHDATSPDTYRFSAEGTPALSLDVSLAGASAQGSELRTGQPQPFAGWVVLDREPTPAPTIVVRRPADGRWNLTAFALREGTAAGLPGVRMHRWQDAEHWVASVWTRAGRVTLTRDGLLLTAERDGAAANQATLAAVAPSVATTQRVHQAFADAQKRYHRFPEFLVYRVRVSQALLVAFAAQELILVLLVVLMLRGGRQALALRLCWASRVTVSLAWLAAGFWLQQVYLGVH